MIHWTTSIMYSSSLKVFLWKHRKQYFASKSSNPCFYIKLKVGPKTKDLYFIRNLQSIFDKFPPNLVPCCWWCCRVWDQWTEIKSDPVPDPGIQATAWLPTNLGPRTTGEYFLNGWFGFITLSWFCQYSLWKSKDDVLCENIYQCLVEWWWEGPMRRVSGPNTIIVQLVDGESSSVL